MIGVLERAVLRAAEPEPRHPPLFVVGAPRCGTTVVYLHLVNRFRFAYFPNAAKRHPGAPVTFTWLARRLGRFRPRWTSRYGEVEGRLAPSDGWGIFHRWFPCYDHSRPVREERLPELRAVVALHERIFGAPFINKNNNNSTRIGHLARLFPRALFVHVWRDLRDASASLLEARRRHEVGVGEWWSAAPPAHHDREFGDEMEQVLVTLGGLWREIEDRLGGLERDRWIDVSYRDFCRDPAWLEERVEAMYGGRGAPLRRRSAVGVPSDYVPRSRSWEPADEAAYRRAVRRLEAGSPGLLRQPGEAPVGAPGAPTPGASP